MMVNLFTRLCRQAEYSSWSWSVSDQGFPPQDLKYCSTSDRCYPASTPEVSWKALTSSSNLSRASENFIFFRLCRQAEYSSWSWSVSDQGFPPQDLKYCSRAERWYLGSNPEVSWKALTSS